MKYLFLFFLVVGNSFTGFTQDYNPNIDSLITNYQAYKNVDAVKIYKLGCIAEFYKYRDSKKALLYADSLVMLAKQVGNIEELAKAFKYNGEILETQSQLTEAFKNFDYASNLLANKTNTTALRLRMGLMQSIGHAYYAKNEYAKSLDTYKMAMDIAFQVKDTGAVFNINNSLGTIYMGIADWQTALSYMKKIQVIGEENNERLLQKNNSFPFTYAAAFLNMGIIYGVLKQYEESVKCFNKVFVVFKKYRLGEEIAAYAAGALSDTYHKMKEYGKAYKVVMLAYNYHTRRNLQHDLSTDYNNLGRIFRDAPDSILINRNVLPINRYDTVLKLLTKSINIAKSIPSLTREEDPTEDMSILYEKMGNYSMAYEYYKKFKIIHDSVGDRSQQKRILINDMQYQFGRQTDSLKFSQALIQSHLREQLSANEQKTIIANKEKELQYLALLQSQTQLENKNLENNKNEKELSLIKKEQELQASQVSKLAKDKELSDYRLKQQRIYGIIGSICLLAFSSLIIYNNYLRRKRMAAGIAKDKAEQQLKEAELQNRMNDITLSALRSQMNPHFIFNCLNSIKLYTKENNTAEASDYIGKFAKLIRNMLDNSRSDRVSLQSEIESLKLYIELEAMRFKNKLQYAITVDKNLDTTFIDIPPLLVQPYIENAIWHGLMPKKEGGHININISQNVADNLLMIDVIDDGIGRTASAVINSNKHNYHKSMGTVVTGERIALINEKYQSKANVVITDLYNNNLPAGTQVTIKLPME